MWLEELTRNERKGAVTESRRREEDGGCSRRTRPPGSAPKQRAACPACRRVLSGSASGSEEGRAGRGKADRSAEVQVDSRWSSEAGWPLRVVLNGGREG